MAKVNSGTFLSQIDKIEAIDKKIEILKKKARSGDKSSENEMVSEIAHKKIEQNILDIITSNTHCVLTEKTISVTDNGKITGTGEQACRFLRTLRKGKKYVMRENNDANVIYHETDIMVLDDFMRALEETRAKAFYVKKIEAELKNPDISVALNLSLRQLDPTVCESQDIQYYIDDASNNQDIGVSGCALIKSYNPEPTITENNGKVSTNTSHLINTSLMNQIESIKYPTYYVVAGSFSGVRNYEMKITIEVALFSETVN
ncbi:hypothetical protein EIN_150750 [Entamoeba invadens IP1]|uniref:Uncharacterized protein n=1 Tax=Entamoeba invadens IP1 TaxID=370355 RepID=A0A0A1UBW0_ENTIV|nr:hypothetical protein EIN_150750 [Entamoeba invadens IP1]ELP91198.1 hypothetical protein EIN_150750 [Entamoeba invadens IP1]|eukprot:XP_004257969.1 hypothetical protein EIN_150750 [Entamoeba invadens IP1]